jgi:hypothetical protein
LHLVGRLDPGGQGNENRHGDKEDRHRQTNEAKALQSLQVQATVKPSFFHIRFLLTSEYP